MDPVKNNKTVSILIITAIYLMACALTLQLFADTQMHRYRKSGRKGLIRTGLWKNSRHPNYLGEILMWWGVAVQAVSVMPDRWWLMALLGLCSLILGFFALRNPAGVGTIFGVLLGVGIFANGIERIVAITALKRIQNRIRDLKESAEAVNIDDNQQ